MSQIEIPDKLKELVERELEPSEKVKWAEQPVPRFFSPKSLSLFLFAIPWTAFAIFWMFGASKSGNLIFTSFGIPFVLVGLSMLSSPIWGILKSNNTIYVITTHRAITFDGGRSNTIRSYPPEKLKNVYRVERKNNIGDVIISYKEWRDSDGDRQRDELGFINIRNPKEVEKKLKFISEY